MHWLAAARAVPVSGPERCSASGAETVIRLVLLHQMLLSESLRLQGRRVHALLIMCFVVLRPERSMLRMMTAGLVH